MAVELDPSGEWDDFKPSRKTNKLLSEISGYLEAVDPEEFFHAEYISKHRISLKKAVGAFAVGLMTGCAIYGGVELGTQLVTAWEALPTVFDQIKP